MKTAKGVEREMSVKRARRGICKANRCLVDKRESQQLLSLSNFRFLRKILTRKAQLVVYLDLVKMHLSDGTIPPGLQIDVKPPGYSDVSKEDDMDEWTLKTKQCSNDLLVQLRLKYCRDIRKCDDLIQHCVSQLVTIISRLRSIPVEQARQDVHVLVQKISDEASRELLARFDKVERSYFTENTRDVEYHSLGDEFKSLNTPKYTMSQLLGDSKRIYDNIRLERNDTFSIEGKAKIYAEEEETKYLEFMNAVTDEILARRIYSDRLLTLVMLSQFHRFRGTLNQERMLDMLRKLQQDMGISADFTIGRIETFSKYPQSHDISSMLGYVCCNGWKAGNDERPPSRTTWKTFNDAAKNEKNVIEIGRLNTTVKTQKSEFELRSTATSIENGLAGTEDSSTESRKLASEETVSCAKGSTRGVRFTTQSFDDLNINGHDLKTDDDFFNLLWTFKD